MNTSIYRRAFLYLLFILIVSLPIRGNAQTPTPEPARIIINYTEIKDGILHVYYSILDQFGQAMLGFAPVKAEMSIDNDNPVEALLGPAQAPLYIALILDASTSMERLQTPLKTAAIEAVNRAPDSAYFAVVQFDLDFGPRLMSFSTGLQQKQAAQDAINRYQTGSGGTCLFDAIYYAAQMMDEVKQLGLPPGRQVILSFTDGRDEKSVNGQLVQCSTHSLNEAIGEATKNNVPVNALGFAQEGNQLDENSLRQLAEQTGGIFSKSDDLQLLFQQAFDALSNQGDAQIAVCPLQPGVVHQGKLDVWLPNATEPLSASFPFSSEQIVKCPEKPDLEIVNYVQEENSVNFYLDLNLIDHLEIEVLRENVNAPVYQDDHVEPDQETNPLSIPMDNFKESGTYFLAIWAHGLDGNVYKYCHEKRDLILFSEQENDFNQCPDYSFELNLLVPPPPPPPQITPNCEERFLQITLPQQNEVQIYSYTGWIEDSDGLKIPESDFSYPAPLPSDGFTISIDNLRPEVEYTFIVQTQGDNGLVSEPTEKAFKSPCQPIGLGSKILKWVSENLELMGVLLILLIIAGALIYRSIFTKQPQSRQAISNRKEESKKSPHPPPDQTLLVRVPPGKAWLEIKASPDRTQKRFEIQTVPLTIGREMCDLNINDPHISRSHAQITLEKDIFKIVDLGSANGTQVKGRPIPANKATPLTSNSVIQLGPETELVFREK